MSRLINFAMLLLLGGGLVSTARAQSTMATDQTEPVYPRLYGELDWTSTTLRGSDNQAYRVGLGPQLLIGPTFGRVALLAKFNYTFYDLSKPVTRPTVWNLGLAPRYNFSPAGSTVRPWVGVTATWMRRHIDNKDPNPQTEIVDARLPVSNGFEAGGAAGIGVKAAGIMITAFTNLGYETFGDLHLGREAMPGTSTNGPVLKFGLGIATAR